MKERIHVTVEVETVHGASTRSKRRRDADGKEKKPTLWQDSREIEVSHPTQFQPLFPPPTHTYTKVPSREIEPTKLNLIPSHAPS
jgi:hypothetical protein